MNSQRERLIYVSLAEVSLIVTMLFSMQPMHELSYPWQEMVSRSVFATICVLGVIAGVAPNWCFFDTRSERRTGGRVAGHHPDCGHFDGHIIHIGSRLFCAGCSGLVIGAILAFLGLLSGFYPLEAKVGLWIGGFLVGLGLAQHYIDFGSSWIHLLLNVFLVFGAWIMFEAIQLMSLSLLVSIYFLAVIVFWIYARIRISQCTHVGVCKECHDDCSIRFE